MNFSSHLSVPFNTYIHMYVCVYNYSFRLMNAAFFIGTHLRLYRWIFRLENKNMDADDRYIKKKKKRIIWLLVWQDRSMAMGPLAFNFPRGWIMIMWTLGIRTGIKWVLVSVLRFPAGTLFNLTRRRANVDGNFCWMWWWSLDPILIDEEIPSVYITSHSRI